MDSVRGDRGRRVRPARADRGCAVTILLAESLRIAVGNEVDGLDGTIYGLLLVIFIPYMPKRIFGVLFDLFARRSGTPPPGGLRPARKAAQ